MGPGDEHVAGACEAVGLASPLALRVLDQGRGRALMDP